MHTFQISALLLFGPLLAGVAHTASASQAEADERTQDALALDAHPLDGALQFKHHCQSCHGADALGVPHGSAPVLAGQRFTYLRAVS